MPSLARPSAAASRTLTAAALALKLVPRDVRNEINRTTRAVMAPEWKEAVDFHAKRKMDRIVLAKGARVKPGNPTVLVAASSRRPLSGGLIPDQSNHAFEYGAGNRDEPTTYERSNRRAGGTHSVTRRTKRQLPPRSRGRVVHSAAAEMIPRFAALWVQTITKKIYDAHRDGRI